MNKVFLPVFSAKYLPEEQDAWITLSVQLDFLVT